MRVIYNEVEPQLMSIDSQLVVSSIFKYGCVYETNDKPIKSGKSGSFYYFNIGNFKVCCGKNHFLTERQMRKLKLQRINESSL